MLKKNLEWKSNLISLAKNRFGTLSMRLRKKNSKFFAWLIVDSCTDEAQNN